MRSFAAWFGRLAMAGVCLAGAGCGGGDVPDPDSDRRAAPSEPSRVVDKGAAEAPAPEAPTALASNASPAEGEKPAAKPEPAETEKPAPALKGDASGTEEMLRMAGPQGATPPAADAPGGSGSAPANPVPGSGSAGGGSGSPGAMAPTPSITPPTAPGGSASGPNSLDAVIPAAPGGEAQPAPGGRGPRRGPGAMAGGGQPAAPGGGIGGSGGGGSAGGTGVAPQGDGPGFGGMQANSGMAGSGAGGLPAAYQGKNAFRLPGTAVVAFLAAVKSKNKDRLAETVAKRAPTEADEKHRKIFSEIIDGSISDDDLDEMAKALEGFQVMTVLQAKSTRVVKVVISKMSGRDRLQRSIVTRQEIDGWKVLDIEAMYDFKPGLPPMFMRGRGGRRR